MKRLRTVKEALIILAHREPFLIRKDGTINESRLADFVRIPQSTIHRIMKGSFDSFREPTARKIGDAFKASYGQVMGFDPIDDVPFSENEIQKMELRREEELKLTKTIEKLKDDFFLDSLQIQKIIDILTQYQKSDDSTPTIYGHNKGKDDMDTTQPRQEPEAFEYIPRAGAYFTLQYKINYSIAYEGEIFKCLAVDDNHVVAVIVYSNTAPASPLSYKRIFLIQKNFNFLPLDRKLVDFLELDNLRDAPE